MHLRWRWMSWWGAAWLLIVLLPWSTAAAWPHEQREGQFFLYADFPIAEAQEAVAELQKLRRQVAAQLQTRLAEAPIEIYLFAKESTYHRYVRRHFPSAPQRRALFVQVSGQGMVFAHKGEALIEDVRHETTHALLNATFPRIPIWADEGLAECFEVQEHHRVDAHPHAEQVRSSAQAGRLESLAALEGKSDVHDLAGNFSHAIELGIRDPAFGGDGDDFSFGRGFKRTDLNFRRESGFGRGTGQFGGAGQVVGDHGNHDATSASSGFFASFAARRIASNKLFGLALPCQAMSRAVPWSTDVRTTNSMFIARNETRNSPTVCRQCSSVFRYSNNNLSRLIC